MRPKPLSWSHGSQVYTAAHKAKSSPVKQVQRQSLRSSRRSAEKSRKERRVETDRNLRTIQRNAPLPSLQLAQKRLPGSRLPCRPKPGGTWSCWVAAGVCVIVPSVVSVCCLPDPCLTPAADPLSQQGSLNFHFFKSKNRVRRRWTGSAKPQNLTS